jgi:putative salt-induced outer membrane protein YdiY
MRTSSLIFLFLLTASANAQVNTEALRLGRAESGLSGSLGVLFSVDLGNSELTKLEVNPDAVWRGGKHNIFSINKLTSVSSGTGSILNKGFSHLRYNLHLTQRLIPEVFLQAQYDHSRDLEQRYLVGSGVRIVAVTRPRSLLAFGVTAMYESEELDTGGITEFIRASDYVSVKLSKPDVLAFSTTLYVQPAFADFEDVRILLSSSLGVAISKHLSVTTKLEYLHDSKPPEDTRKYDLGIANGLSLSF